MPIVSSQILTQTPQQDGTKSILERHLDHNGLSYDFQYFAEPDIDINNVLMLRAANLGKEIDRREREAAEAANYTIPIKAESLIIALTPQERAGIRTAATTDPTISDVLYVFERRQTINPNSDLTRQMFGLLVQKGLLTQARVDELLGMI